MHFLNPIEFLAKIAKNKFNALTKKRFQQGIKQKEIRKIYFF